MYYHFIVYRENRYLLFLTENYSALQTLKQYIIATTETVESEEDFCEPFVLFGSSFPKDNEYSQVHFIYHFINLSEG